MRSRIAQSDGFATLAVLVIGAMLAASVAAAMAVTQPALNYSRLSAQDVAAEALLDAGLAIAGHGLFFAGRQLAAASVSRERLDTGVVRMTAIDEAARVDLNAADAELLARLYAVCGATAMPAEIFAARVIDWRDGDDVALPGGAERKQYAAAAIAHAPRNGPLRTVSDLRFVAGLTDADIARLAPHLTVLNPAGGIDPVSASTTVLAALADLSPADLSRLVEARRAGVADHAALLARLAAPSRHLLSQPSGIYRVRLAARTSSGFLAEAEAVIAGPGIAGDDIGVLGWWRISR
jgi:type II secretory pathway component PulK